MLSERRLPGAKVAVIVAHPDDETLWAGGTLLEHPEWDLCIVTLNHRTDPRRAPRFHQALARFGARGAMGDLRDDGREGKLPEGLIENTILTLLPRHSFDLILTHSPSGEYTEHLMHDEVSDAVRELFSQGRLEARELWHFAFDDQGGAALPRAERDATWIHRLSRETFEAKRDIVTRIYGFAENDWETLVTPPAEGFRLVHPDPAAARVGAASLMLERPGGTP